MPNKQQTKAFIDALFPPTITLETLEERAKEIGRNNPLHYQQWPSGVKIHAQLEWLPNDLETLLEHVEEDYIDMVMNDYNHQLFALAVNAAHEHKPSEG